MIRASVGFLTARSVWAPTAILMAQALTFYKFAQNERPPATLPLRLISMQLGDWSAEEERDLDDYAREILSPDDAIVRNYTDARNTTANLFVAYFKTQRTDH